MAKKIVTRKQLCRLCNGNRQPQVLVSDCTAATVMPCAYNPVWVCNMQILENSYES